MTHTLEQQRAQYSWKQVKEAPADFVNLAKGAPALIMSNGLMASLAFWQSRKNSAAAVHLVNTLINWLAERKFLSKVPFAEAMNELVTFDSNKYMLATSESLDLLKWLRQLAAAK